MRRNQLPQNCCVCGKLCVTNAGFIEYAQLTEGRNDVFHEYCAEEYYKRVKEKLCKKN